MDNNDEIQTKNVMHEVIVMSESQPGLVNLNVNLDAFSELGYVDTVTGEPFQPGSDEFNEVFNSLKVLAMDRISKEILMIRNMDFSQQSFIAQSEHVIYKESVCSLIILFDVDKNFDVIVHFGEKSNKDTSLLYGLIHIFEILQKI